MRLHPFHILKATWPYLAILTAHLVWGVNFIAAKLTLMEVPTMSLAFLRFFLALLLLIPFILIERKKHLIKNKELKIDINDLPKLFLAGTLTITLAIALFYEGLIRTTAVDASILSLNVPILSVLIGWWFLKEKVYTVNVLGITLGLIGAILVIGLPSLLIGRSFTDEKILGDILIALSGLSFVTGALISKSLLKKYSSLTLTTIYFAVGAITFLIPALKDYLNNPYWFYQMSFVGVVGLTYIVIASSIAAFFLFEWGLSKLGIIKADLIQYIEPLIATTLAVFILSEQIHYSFIVGAILIGLGVYWGTLGKDNHKHSKAHRN